MTRQETPEAFLRIQDTPIYFQEDWKRGIGGGLWSTGLAIAKYLEHHPDHVLYNLKQQDERKLSLLELGSGNGLLSVCFLALAKDYLSNLVITDTTEPHLELMQQTVNANTHILGNHDDATKITVMEHNWGDFDEKETDGDNKLEAQIRQGRYKFDVIVGSDVAYRTELYDPLIASLLQYSHSKTISLIGVTMKDTTPRFFHKLREAGFRYERVADHLMQQEFRGNTFGIFVINRRGN